MKALTTREPKDRKTGTAPTTGESFKSTTSIGAKSGAQAETATLIAIVSLSVKKDLLMISRKLSLF